MNVEYIVTGGGGGGGGGQWHPSSCSGGGGGAGGVYQATATLAWSTAYDIAVGAGGGDGQGTSITAKRGGDSAIFNVTNWVPGGGGGGLASEATGASGGSSGASGGGAGTSSDGTSSPGAGTFGYACGGGMGYSSGDERCGSGGGGGWNVPGGGHNVSTGKAGNGGTGYLSDFDGTYYYYGEGGGGGSGYSAASGGGGGNGGNGHAGAGGGGENTSGAPAPYQGIGGGGGGAGYRGFRGGVGASGSVKIRYAGPQTCSGGTVVSYSGYTVHIFLTAGQFITPAPPIPTIHTIDNTTTGAVNDAVVIQGTTAYTHIWGTNMVAGAVGSVSGTGVTAPYAAGQDTLIALNITTAIDAPLGARTIQVVNPSGYGSNGMTLTVVAPVPTLTGISTGQGGAAQGFVGIKTRVTITGTGFQVGGTNVYAPEGVTVSNVVVSSNTSLTCDFLGSGVTGVGVYVTTVGGTSNTIGFTMLAVTAIANAGMIVNHILAAAYNSHPGTLGCYFTVGAKDMLVTHLGRFKWGTNNKKHILTLRDGAWQGVAQTIIDLSVGTMDQWQYAPLATPVLLKKGLNYVLADMDNSGISGEYWAGHSSVATDGNATVNGYIVEASSMFRFTRGTDRVDPYTLGFSFIAQAAYTVTALGRWKIPGNSRTHIVVLKDAAGTIVRQVTVDFTSGKGLDNAFNYVSVPLLALTTGARYYLESEEMQGDVWPNYPNTITPWGGLNITDSCYEGQQYPVNGVIPTLMGTGPNTSHSMPDILCLINQSSGYSESYVTMNLLWKNALQPMAMII